jgi:hypothetical protein
MKAEGDAPRTVCAQKVDAGWGKLGIGCYRNLLASLSPMSFPIEVVVTC